MGFLKKILSNKIFRAVAPIILGATPLGPVAGALAGAGIGASQGGGITGALTGAASGYFGGSALSGAMSGAAGLPVAGSVGPTAGGISGAISGAGAGVAGAASNIGQALGITGSTVSNLSSLASAGSMFAPSQKSALSQQQAGTSTVEKPFSPKRPDEMTRPKILSPLAEYSPEQERSALATKGLNTGLDDSEKSYYQNLVQRSLIGEGNQVNVSNPNFLMPIESSYFSKQGLNTSDIMQFLRGMQA